MTPPSYHQCSKIDCFECHKNAVGAVFPTPHEKLREAWKKHVEYDDIIEEFQDCADDASAWWLAKLDEALAADRLAQRAEMRGKLNKLELSMSQDFWMHNGTYKTGNSEKEAYNLALSDVEALLTDEK